MKEIRFYQVMTALCLLTLLVIVLTCCSISAEEPENVTSESENTTEQPFVFTGYKEIDCGESVFMAWTTNYDSQCLVQYCYKNTCDWTPLDTEWDKLHTIIMPSYYSLTIRAIDADGETISLPVREQYENEKGEYH